MSKYIIATNRYTMELCLKLKNKGYMEPREWTSWSCTSTNVCKVGPYDSERNTKDVVLVLHPNSSQRSIVVQVYTMWINEPRSNIVRHHLITGHWCISLTNVRQPTNNGDGSQGTMELSNMFEWMGSHQTPGRNYQVGDIDVFPF
jgi:hypothetical protein